MATDDRTEQPTTRRRRDARRRGQVARSRDLVHAASMAAAMMAIGWFGPYMMRSLGASMGNTLAQLHRFPANDLHADELGLFVINGLGSFFAIVAPVMLSAAVSSVAIFYAQGGWNFSTEALQLNFNKLNPASGIKRLGFSAGGLDTLKMLLLVIVLSFLGYRAIVGNLAETTRFARMSPYESGRAGWGWVETLLQQAAFVMLVVGVADYAVQKWRLTKSLKMTKQEVKDDLKMTEGNPEIKARVRRIQMTMARKRMLAAVPTATVVVTNPTHYAVALEYRRSEMSAPRVVAKGRGFLAQKIKAIARDHGVPTVENVPLAQSLYKTVEVGEFIPAALFEAVAEILAYLIRLKQIAL